MSALQDMVNGVVAEHEVTVDDLGLAPTEFAPAEFAPIAYAASAARGGFRGRLDALSLSGKLRAIAYANVFAIVISVLATIAGGVAAMQMRAEHMAVSEATVISAGVVASVNEGSRFVQHLANTGNRADIKSAQDAFRQADRDLSALTVLVAEVAPEQLPALEAMNRDLAAVTTAVMSLQDTSGTQAQYQVFADEVYAIGEKLVGEAVKTRDDLQLVAAETDSRGQATVGWLFLGFFGVAFFAIGVVIVSSRYLARDVSGTLGRMTDVATRLAAGDKDIHIPGIGRGDEIGDLARALEVFHSAAFEFEQMARERESMRANQGRALARVAEQFESTVGEVVGSVAAASSQLQSTASAMAAAAEQASTQTAQVTQSMSQAANGVTAAAAASDEFAMSIGEISRQAAHSAELAREASDTASRADSTISALSHSANQVGQIVELIQTIAKRTNLLALNASIEAARGGTAGRGFAVVASEVKELAAQTSRATEDVAEQIRQMQDSTGASVTALRSIAEQIKQMESTAISIASAVDQQSVAGQDLARNIDLAARSTDEVSANVVQVRESSLTTGAAANQVLGSAGNLESQARILRRQVDEFLRHVRAA